MHCFHAIKRPADGWRDPYRGNGVDRHAEHFAQEPYHPRSELFAAGALAGCGDGKAAPGSTGASGKTGSGYKVGVLQLVEHGALDRTNKGFVAALDESGIAYTIDQQNAQNDQSACQTIASKLVNDGDDLIFAIATPAAQAVAGATSDIPVVGSAITDYAESGLVDSNEEPGGNVTGSSDLTPVADQIGAASPAAARG